MPQPNTAQGQGKVKKKNQQGKRLVGKAVGRPGPGKNEVRNRNRGGAGMPDVAPRRGQPGGLPQQGPNMLRAIRDADLAYGGQIQTAQRGLTNAGTWWDQYKQDLANQQTAIATLYQNAASNLNTPAPVSGVPTAEADQAAGSRDVMRQAFGNLLNTQGAAQGAYFGGLSTAASAQQLQSRTEAQQDLARLSGERDLYKLNRRDELRDQQHTRKLESAAFGLDTAKAQLDAADTAADNQRADRALGQNARAQRQSQKAKGREVNQYGYTNRDWQGMSTQERQKVIRSFDKSGSSAKGDSKRFTPTQLAASRRDFRKVFSDIRKNDNGTEKYGSQIRKTLMDAGADSLLVNAAWQLYKRGSVSPGVAKALFRDYGFKVKQGAKPKKRPKPYSPGGPGSDAAQGNSTEGLGATD